MKSLKFQSPGFKIEDFFWKKQASEQVSNLWVSRAYLLWISTKKLNENKTKTKSKAVHFTEAGS